MGPAHCERLLMVVADNPGSHDDACAVDKSQRYGSNGSSKQHDVEQMPVRWVDAFVHKPLHTVPVNWWLADEQHAVSSATVNVYASSVEAIIVAD